MIEENICKKKFLFFEKLNFFRNPKNMTLDEVCSLILSFSVLNLEYFNLIDDCLNQVKVDFDKLSNGNLIHMLCAGKYYINYSKHSGKLNETLFFLIFEKIIYLIWLFLK